MLILFSMILIILAQCNKKVTCYNIFDNKVE